MTITEPQIRRIMPNAKGANIRLFVESFNRYSENFGITTKMRACAFISQIAHESSELNHLEENLNYSDMRLVQVFPKYFNMNNAHLYSRKPEKIANRIYANRMGNGNEESGDGWKYKGRGLIMLTGKSNYAEYEKSGFCVGDIMDKPELLAQYPGALKSAMFFWLKHNLNRFADKEDIVGMTKVVNGGTLGLAQRLYYFRVAKKVFCI